MCTTPPLTYGTKNQISFRSLNDFYESLGFLCRNKGMTSIQWENNENQGAWASEGRIHFYYTIDNVPYYFSNAFTAGTGNIINRVNCNEYINKIIELGFTLGLEQNIINILKNIPSKYQENFKHGLNL